MNKATLNQIATYSPINTYLSFSRGESRGQDTYGYPILRLTCSSSGEVFKCMGGGYDMHGTNLGSFLTSTVREYPEALKALATGVYNEIHKGNGIPYGLNIRNLDACKKDGKPVAAKVRKVILENNFYLDGACGESCIKKIANLIGLNFTDDYQRAKTRKGTDKFLGTRVSVDPEGQLVKYLAKAKQESN